MPEQRNHAHEPFVRALDAGDCHILTVRGEVDLSVAPALRVGLTGALHDKSGPLVLDMRDVTFIDSTALSVLIEAQAGLKVSGRPLVLACGDGVVTRLLTLAGLGALFPLYPTPEDAVAALKSTRVDVQGG